MSGNVSSPQYPGAQPAPVQQFNPLGVLDQYSTIQNKLNQNTQFQQEQQYRSQIGDILRQSIDPTTGQPDFNKAFASVASNPATSKYSMEFLDQAVKNNQTNVQTAGMALEQHQQQYNNVVQGLTPLVAMGPNVTKDAVRSKLAEQVASGVTSPSIAAAFLAPLPESGQPLQYRLGLLSLQAQGAVKAIEQVNGQMQAYNRGGQTDVGIGGTSPYQQGGPGFHPTQTLVNTPSPDTNNELVPRVDPATGKTEMVPRAQAAPTYTGGVNPQAANTAAGGATAPAPVKGLSATDNFALNTYYPDLQKRAQESQTSLQNYQKSMDLLQEINTGATSPNLTKIAALAKALGANDETLKKIGQGDVDAAQQYGKQAYLNAMNTGVSAVGGGHLSNMQSETALNALPSLQTSPGAAKGMYEYMSKLAELPLKEQKAFQQFQDKIQQPGGYVNPNTNRKYSIGDFPAFWSEMLEKSHVIRDMDPNANMNRLIAKPRPGATPLPPASPPPAPSNALGATGP